MENVAGLIPYAGWENRFTKSELLRTVIQDRTIVISFKTTFTAIFIQKMSIAEKFPIYHEDEKTRLISTRDK